MGREAALTRTSNAAGDDVRQASLQAPLRANTCAIIVSYHPGEQIARLVERIAPQVAAFIIVDNNSGDAAVTGLRDLCARHGGILLACAENMGVAGALNRGMERAAQIEQFEWFLLFDQDTQPDAAMVEGIASVWRDYHTPERIGLIGCNWIDRLNGRPDAVAPAHVQRPWLETDFVITSGSALPRHVYAQVGGMRDAFFIDMVDTEFCLRVIAHGYVILKTVAPLFDHMIGAKSAHRFLNRRVVTTNHSPARRYFMMRNSVILAREQLRHDPARALDLMRQRLKNLLFISLYEDQRGPKLRAMLRGLWDGIFARMEYNPLAQTRREHT